MKRSIVGALLGMMILTCAVFAITAFGQAWEKSKSEPVTALEVLEKTVDDVLTEKMPIQVYPPGYFEWLLEKGDEPMVEQSQKRGFVIAQSAQSSKLSLRSQSDVSSMQAQRLFNPATQKYQIIDLGAGVANAINNKGQVVGNMGGRAFLLSDGIMHDLGISGEISSEAYGINDSGHVVGSITTTNWEKRATRWIDSSRHYLGTLGGVSSEAYGINESGQVVGSAEISSGHNRAFLWSNGSMQNLGTLGGNYSVARGINDYGHIAGTATTSSNYQHAFLWSNSSMQDLGTVGGNYSSAYAINNGGQIVGSSHTNNLAWNDEHAFFYSGGSMHYIGTGAYGIAHGINSSDQVVGWGLIPGPEFKTIATLWSDGYLYDLNDLVDTNLSPQFTLFSANDINDKGQVVGYGRNSLGQTRAFLLNPLPEGWEVITNQPVRLIFGNLPVKQPGKSNLIVVTHGWNPTLNWVYAMTNSINQYLISNNLTTWQVAAYDWSQRAAIPLTDGGFEAALRNGEQDGYRLGEHIKSNGWTHIHFIAHSAGAGLVSAATDRIRPALPSATTVHCTFLDPYVGRDYEGIRSYGRRANWSENYFSRDSESRFASIKTGPFTESLLNHAYNVDVTFLDPNKIIGAKFQSSITGELEPCIKTFTTHGWPVDFYINTITRNTNSSYGGLGFALSKEGGSWNYAMANYSPSNTPARVLGTPDPACLLEVNITPPAWSDKLIDFINSSTIKSTTGTIQKNNNFIKLWSGSPAWLATFVVSTNPANTVSFDAKFTSTNGAQGLLSVYWDDQVIGSLDERVVSSGKYTFSFPNAPANTTHMLGFRLDTFTNIQSSITITNVVLKQIGVSQPFSLSATTNSSNGLVYEFTGEPGFEYIVQASTNLVDWTEIATLVNTNGTVHFFDQNVTNASKRFYRAVAPY